MYCVCLHEMVINKSFKGGDVLGNSLVGEAMAQRTPLTLLIRGVFPTVPRENRLRNVELVDQSLHPYVPPVSAQW